MRRRAAGSVFLKFVTMLYLFLNINVFLGRLVHVQSGPIPGNNQALYFDEVLKAVHYMEDNPEIIEELVSKNAPVVEGDIIADTDRNAVPNIWPTTEIPYVISPEINSRTNDIIRAIKMISEKSCVSFHRRTSETDYLVFKNSPGCASHVGFIGGEQPVFIGSICAVGNIAHEILHSLGFYHEHTRLDREEYITVLTKNILRGSERNFLKQPGKTFNIPYDIHSIMHYGSGYFSSNGLPTILPNKNSKEMGQRVKLTKSDIERVQLLYGCDSTRNVSSGEKTVMGDDPVRNVTAAPDSTTRDGTEPTFVSNPTNSQKVPTYTTAAPSTTLHQPQATTRRHKNPIKG